LCILYSERYLRYFERLWSFLSRTVEGIKEKKRKWYLEDESINGGRWEQETYW
jgi:hypothetical protein